MKLSQSFWQTYKEVPADAEIPSHQLMLRAGLIQKSGSGLYQYLPFGLKILQKIESIVRHEMQNAGAQEVQMSMVTPSELWKESGRWDSIGEIMCKFKDKRDSEVCLSPTNEEAVVDIVRKTIKSYKNLPLNLFQINTKFRDEIRPRFGLMRAREFLMKDAYSFHIDHDSLNETYQKMYEAYEKIFKALELDFVAVEADGGAMASSEQKTHEFQVIAESGEDEIVYSRQTNYAANIEKAKTKRVNLDLDRSELAFSEVSTPNKSTIYDVCQFLKRPQTQSLKSLIYVREDDGQFYLILLLGDDELNEIKFKSYLGAESIRPAKDSELHRLGLPVGFIGPVGLNSEVEIIFDGEVDLEASYVVGGMKKDIHIENFKPSRDLKQIKQADLRLAKASDHTVVGDHPIEIKRGIEVGHIFQLGDKYTKAMNFSVLDQNGKSRNPLMGCYGVGVSRLIAAVIEQCHDEKGIVWPKSCSPFDVHFIAITKSDEALKTAISFYEEIRQLGIDVLIDDRKAGPGFKFKDADLLGIPVQVVFGERDFQEDQTLEIIARKTGSRKKIVAKDLVSELTETLATL